MPANDAVPDTESDAAAQLVAAVKAESWGRVVELIELHWATFMAADITLLRSALAALPPDVLAEHPRLVAARNYVDYIPAGDTDDSTRKTVQFRDTANPGVPEGLLDVLARLTSRAGARRSAGAFAKSVESVDEARDALADASEDRLMLIRPALPELHFQWGKSLEFAALGSRAFQEYRDAFDLAVLTSNELIAANSAGSIAWLAVFGGHADEARLWLARMPGDRHAQGGGAASMPGDSWRQTRHATTSILARVLVLIGTFEFDEAQRRLDELDAALSPEYWAARLYVKSKMLTDAWAARQLLGAIAEALRVRAAELGSSGLNLELLTLARVEASLVLQQPERARHMVHEAQSRIGRMSQSLLIAEARTELVAADYAAAARCADALISLEDARPRVLLTAMLINAVALLHQGAVTDAAGLFARVLQQLTPDDRAVLTAISREDLLALAATIDVSAVAGGAEALAAALERGLFTAPSVSIIRLSPRERSVLAELPGGATISEIAATLQVSPNTVKSQLQSVYRKLGVATREDAEAVAIRYGLLG